MPHANGFVASVARGGADADQVVPGPRLPGHAARLQIVDSCQGESGTRDERRGGVIPDHARTGHTAKAPRRAASLPSSHPKPHRHDVRRIHSA